MTTFERIYKGIASNKTAYFGVFFIITVFTYAILYALDFYPEPVSNEAQEVISEEMDLDERSEIDTFPTTETGTEDVDIIDVPIVTLPDSAILPANIYIPKLDTDVPVLNPDSLDMNDLDTALLDGVARHPQSAHFQDTGNILIFGHSSYLPNVFNKNFQALNGVQDLLWGDEVVLSSEDGSRYTYRVSRVYTVKASETIIDNSRGKAMLTLVTCNSFGSKDDRFIVEATLVESRT